MPASYEAIFNAGRAITGGFGFWGHSSLRDRFAGPKEMVKAWVDGLREHGLDDIDIVFYGDWSDGRHIADNIGPDTTYAQFKRAVKKEARSPVAIFKGNRENYAATQPKRWELAERALRGEEVEAGNWK